MRRVARARLDLAEEPAFSTAMSAWSAKVRTISIWRSENGEGSGRARAKTPRPDRCAKGHAEGGAVIADPRRLAKVVVRIGEYVREMDGLAAQHHPSGERLAPGADRMLVKELDDLRSAARFGLEPHGVAVAHEQGYE